MKLERIGIVGGGAWGTALAGVVVRAGGHAVVWAREAEVVESINRSSENKMFLPGIPLPPNITATGEFSDLGDTDALLVVTPAQALRQVCSTLKAHLRPDQPVALCSKGIEQSTGKLMSEAFEETVPGSRALVLSGPSFAADVAHGLPTAVTLAGGDSAIVQALAEALRGPAFRPYMSSDVVGAQIGGSVKNVLAIACGIVDGRKLGPSARAALITRGFAEMTRFGTARGADSATLGGLSGLGDLVLTCSSPQSRNMSLGMALGEGRSLDEVLGERNSVSEGVYSAAIVTKMASDTKIEMPICTAVDDILNHGADIDTTIEALLNRPLRSET